MKALKLLSLATMVVMMFASCAKNEPNNPEPTPEPGPTPGPDPELVHSLKGSNYYVLVMDAVTYPKIQDKVKNDMRVNDTDMFLYIWSDTYLAGTTSGPNFFGETEGWPSLVVNNIGWSGGGFIPTAPRTVDLSEVTGDYVLHLATKSKQPASSHLLIINDVAKICIGSSPFVDGTDTYQPYADFTRDGEWTEIEIPMSKFLEKTSFREPLKGNILSFLSGATVGNTLDLDAVFIYKPAPKQ